MENEDEEAGKPRGLTPGRTRALMVLVAVITAIAIWLVPVEEKPAPPSLPEMPSAPATTEPLPLPAAPGMSGTRAPSPESGKSETLPPPSGPATDGEARPPSGAGTSEALALPAPPGGIGTVTSGGERARAFIYELQAGGTQPDPEVVFAEAGRMQGEGNLEDAYLLYRFAARHGQVQAAMTLGTQADPAFHAGAGGYLPEPSPGQAYKWYSMAASAGNGEAAQRLQELRKRMQQDAAAGDEQARRLLLLWQ